MTATATISLDIQYDDEDLAQDTVRFRQAASWVANKFQLRELTVSIAIVDDSSIHQVNRDHLNHDWPTDVISFLFEDNQACIDGEIIASAETANALCTRAGWSQADEILLYVVHGLLHLAGLNDVNQSQRVEMRKYEQACLSDLGVAGADRHIERWNDVTT